MFLEAQNDLGTTPFPAARHRLRPGPADGAPGLPDGAETGGQISDGSPLAPIQVLTLPDQHHPGDTMVPVR